MADGPTLEQQLDLLKVSFGVRAKLGNFVDCVHDDR